MLPEMLDVVIGIILGIVFVCPTIYMIQKRGFDDWAWPLFLASLPIWYMLFGVLALDGKAIALELLVGLPYLITAYVTWRMRSNVTLIVLGIAWLSHGFYDYYHDVFFVNPGVFGWYPAFCAVVDMAVGSYLLYRGSVGEDTPDITKT
ncbi:MAG: hypothetical protein ABJ013_08325 [Halioglobus sp.]